MWLRDKLTVDFPNARIMTYGFDSHLKGSHSEAVISVFSSRFCSDVQEIRTHCPVIRERQQTAQDLIDFDRTGL
jgi:hypothetical protein